MMRQGFSLVELSIVLVILGLLTGGILAGQSLIRASELRAVTSEYERYTAATQTFRDKYFAIPGDLNAATRFWTRQANVASCVTNSGVATINAASGSCDGNGDGRITLPTALSLYGETYGFWRQLALAGLIEGTYSGAAGAASLNKADIGVNVPRSKISNAGWATLSAPDIVGGAVNFYVADYGNTLTFGSQDTTVWPYQPALKPEEAWNIDTKMDDGKPGTGKITGLPWDGLCTTSTTNTDYAGTYRLTETGTRCSLVFLRSF